MSGFPDSTNLYNDDHPTPYFIIGDGAFVLRTFLMKPYAQGGLSKDQTVPILLTEPWLRTGKLQGEPGE